MKAHAAANLFPMLSDSELKTLSDDIKANGLIHPITTIEIADETYILDGRNRYRACELAGVTPALAPRKRRITSARTCTGVISTRANAP